MGVLSCINRTSNKLPGPEKSFRRHFLALRRKKLDEFSQFWKVVNESGCQFWKVVNGSGWPSRHFSFKKPLAKSNNTGASASFLKHFAFPPRFAASLAYHLGQSLHITQTHILYKPNMAFKYKHIHKNISTIIMSMNFDFIICIALPRYQLFAVGFIVCVIHIL